MGEEQVQCKLVAIFAADVVGYTRLMEANEERTLGFRFKIGHHLQLSRSLECADIVAKPQAGSFLRNNRIRVAGTTNRNCAARLVHESMLRAAVGKILLQQYRSNSDVATMMAVQTFAPMLPHHVLPEPTNTSFSTTKGLQQRESRRQVLPRGNQCQSGRHCGKREPYPCRMLFVKNDHAPEHSAERYQVCHLASENWASMINEMKIERIGSSADDAKPDHCPLDRTPWPVEGNKTPSQKNDRHHNQRCRYKHTAGHNEPIDSWRCLER
jgi:hypothetical protein